MRQLKINLAIIAMVAISAAMILTASSCTKDGAGTGGDSLSLENAEGVVLATVGATDITLADLFEIPQLYQLVDDRLINNEIIRQEAAKRGITVDMEKIQKEIDDMVMMSGGREQFMANMSPSMPRALIPGDVQLYFTMNAMQKAITEDEYDKTIGVPTGDTIDSEWNSQMDFWRNVYANENEIEDRTTVSKDMARDIIIRELKTRWVSENMGRLIGGLRDQYAIEFILRDLIEANPPVEVPLVSGPSEPQTPEAEPVVPELELSVPQPEVTGDLTGE